MNDVETRLRADGHAWREVIDKDERPGLPSYADETRSARHLMRPALAAAAVLLVALTGLAITRGFGTQANLDAATSPPVGVATKPVVCPWPEMVTSFPGLQIEELGPDQRPLHDAQQALGAARAATVGPEVVTAVYAALLTDPVAVKIAREWGAAPRPMWVIEGTWTVRAAPPESRGPPLKYPVGTVLREFTLVDDATLQAAGSFSCGGG